MKERKSVLELRTNPVRLKILKVGSRDGVSDVQKQRFQREYLKCLHICPRVAYWRVHVGRKTEGNFFEFHKERDLISGHSNS